MCSLHRYLRSWFVLDVASTIPLGAVMAIFTGKYQTGFANNVVNLLRLWRLRRVSAAFARYEYSFPVDVVKGKTVFFLAMPFVS